MEVKLHPSPAVQEILTKFIENLDVKMQKKILRTLEKIEMYGSDALKALGVKKLVADKNIWELRFKQSKLLVRLLYVIRSNTLWIIHGFIKKQQKTPIREIKTAIRRVQDIK